LYLIGKNNTSEGEIYTVNVYNGSTSLGEASISSWQGASNLASLGKLSEGSYSFRVMYNDEVICSHSITVVNPVGCSVSASNIELGESVTISTTYPGNCWGSSFTASPSEGSGVSNPWACQSSYTVTPTVAGTYTYKYAVTGGAYDVDSCSKTVTVEQVPPTFTCPSNVKASIGASDNVKFALTGVTGCDEGGDYCNYSVTGDGNISVSGNSYTGGSRPVFTDNTVTSEDSKSYTVRLTNSAGYVEHTCSVDFVEGSSGSEGDTIILNYQGELTTITAGTYTIYSTNQWSGVMRCEADETVTVTVDGVEKTVNTSISSLDGANPRTNVSVVLVVPPGKEIRCHTDW
jgi:hypothetical protein